MAGALSGHIIESYYSTYSQPFGFGIPNHPTFNKSGSNPWPSSSTNIVTSGAMSFDPDMHGNSEPTKLISDLPEENTSYMNLSKSTAIKIAALQAKLNQQLGPEYISTRPGGGGTKLVYAEGWKIINLANEVFGFNGWCSNLVSLTTDFIDQNEESKRYSVGVTAIVRVTLRDGVFHEDVGYGILENSKTKGPALDKCKKEAVTDGLKRCLRNFGNLLGNCLYDKQYTNEIVKIKVNPPKFNKENLYRRPEFAHEANSAVSSSSSSSTSKPSAATSTTPVVKSETVAQKPLSSIPSHVRESARAESSSSSSTTPANTTHNTIPINNKTTINASTPVAGASNRGSAARQAAILHGLNTPMATPAAQVVRLPPPKEQPAANTRHVAFADSPLANRANTAVPAPPDESFDGVGAEDESFTFGSEDDAFFATVDLGEVDLGRPIDFAEGTGNGTEEEAQTSIIKSEPTDAARTRDNPPASSSTHALSSSVTTSSTISPFLPPNTDTEHNQQQQQHQRPMMNHTRASETTNRHAHLVFGTGNASKDSPTIAATSTPAPRRMGGFTFPPDVLNRQPQAQQAIGVKRPAEAMKTSMSSRDRRLGPGMGLSAQGGSVARQQLNLGGMSLDREDGGNVKRARY